MVKFLWTTLTVHQQNKFYSTIENETDKKYVTIKGFYTQKIFNHGHYRIKRFDRRNSIVFTHRIFL